jgi:hypothetical protein
MPPEIDHDHLAPVVAQLEGNAIHIFPLDLNLGRWGTERTPDDPQDRYEGPYGDHVAEYGEDADQGIHEKEFLSNLAPLASCVLLWIGFSELSTLGAGLGRPGPISALS